MIYRAGEEKEAERLKTRNFKRIKESREKIKKRLNKKICEQLYCEEIQVRVRFVGWMRKEIDRESAEFSNSKCLIGYKELK